MSARCRVRLCGAWFRWRVCDGVNRAVRACNELRCRHVRHQTVLCMVATVVFPACPHHVPFDVVSRASVGIRPIGTVCGIGGRHACGPQQRHLTVGQLHFHVVPQCGVLHGIDPHTQIWPRHRCDGSFVVGDNHVIPVPCNVDNDGRFFGGPFNGAFCGSFHVSNYPPHVVRMLLCGINNIIIISDVWVRFWRMYKHTLNEYLYAYMIRGPIANVLTIFFSGMNHTI